MDIVKEEIGKALIKEFADNGQDNSFFLRENLKTAISNIKDYHDRRLANASNLNEQENYENILLEGEIGGYIKLIESLK